MTKIINLFGGPGTGKSTNASILFALLKEAGREAELINEYVKQWAWEERKPVNYDQFYFFGKQARREYTLFGKVEFIISDAPAALCGYYANLHGTPEQGILFNNMVRTYHEMCAEDGVQHLNYFLERVNPYNAVGRFQNEGEAKKIDREMKLYLRNDLKFEFEEIESNRRGMEKLFHKLNG